MFNFLSHYNYGIQKKTMSKYVIKRFSKSESDDEKLKNRKKSQEGKRSNR